MASSPRLDADPLLQLHEVDSSKTSERPSSPQLLPAIVYSPPPPPPPPPGMDNNHTVCIPSPYTDSSHEFGHGPLTFYSPPVLSYSVSDSQSSLCPPLSPSAFWPSHSHANVPSLTLRCPQPPPLVYSEPSPHTPWMEAKAHAITPHRWDTGSPWRPVFTLV